MEPTNDLGGRRAEDDPVASHLSAALTRLLELFAQYLLQWNALPAMCEVTPTGADLSHQVCVAQDVECGLESLVLFEVDQDGSRPSVARHHDLFLALLDARHQLRQMRFHV